jgi:hypothetical protein
MCVMGMMGMLSPEQNFTLNACRRAEAKILDQLNFGLSLTVGVYTLDFQPSATDNMEHMTVTSRTFDDRLRVEKEILNALLYS